MLSSMEGLAKHAWDTAQEHILKKWKCQLFVHMYMQAEARTYFRALYNWMSTPVILLNTSAAAAIFVSSRSDVKDYILLAMTLSAAILATLTRSMQVAELYQQHGSSCLRYSSLLHDIESVLNMRVDLRPSALSYIDKVKSDMDNIMSAQAEPPEHVVRSFERAYGRVDGLLYGEDVVRVVLTNMRTNSYLQDIYSHQTKALRRHDSTPMVPSPPPSASQTPAPNTRWSLAPFLRASLRQAVPPPFMKMSYQHDRPTPSSSPFESEEFRRIVASVDRIHVSIDNQESKGITTGGRSLGEQARGGSALISNTSVPPGVVLSLFDSTPSTSVFERSEEGTPKPPSRTRVCPIVWDTASDITPAPNVAPPSASSSFPALLHATSPFAVPVPVPVPWSLSTPASASEMASPPVLARAVLIAPEDPGTRKGTEPGTTNT